MDGALATLTERGFIQQCTNLPALDHLLNHGPVTFYCGFDPTGPSLQAGHLIPLFAMAHLYRAGHRPIVLIGGGTALIGDPTGRTEIRKIQTREQIAAHAEAFKIQIARFIDFSDRSIMLNNADWLTELNYIEFLRDIGRHFSVNRMLSFETYKTRMEKGLSFIEFNYQLLQSYDFLALYREYGCLLQIGGDDQWGNIVAGADLLRRVEGVEAIGLTFPLVTTADGKKMGKTEKGALLLDPNLTPPYEFFQYWRNVADADVGQYLKRFTFLPIDEIQSLEALEGASINLAKERLAYELTKIVHGAADADRAIAAARAAFSEVGTSAGAAYGGASASAGEGSVDAIPSIEVSRSEFEAGVGVLDLFSRTSLCSSKSEARRLVEQGGAAINDEKVSDVDAIIGAEHISGSGLVLRAGKKRYFRVVVI